MLKLNYIAHTLLNTKYKIILFLIFYIICIKLHYIDFNSTLVECMQRSNSFEKEKEILQIAGHLKEKSTINSTWNNVRNFFGYERIDTATIDSPLEKAAFLERYAEFVKNIREKQFDMQRDYQTLSEKHQEKVENLVNLKNNFDDQKLQIQELRRINEQQAHNLRFVCQTMSEQLNNIEILINKKSNDILNQSHTNAAFSKKQLNYMKKNLAEIAIGVGVTETSFEEFTSKQRGLVHNFEQEFIKNEIIVDHIFLSEIESNSIQLSLQEKNTTIVNSALQVYSPRTALNLTRPEDTNSLTSAISITETQIDNTNARLDILNKNLSALINETKSPDNHSIHTHKKFTKLQV